MPNLSGNAYGLTTLCPVLPGGEGGQSYVNRLRSLLESLPLDEGSPMARVPNTYLARFFVLDKVVYEGLDLVDAIPVPVPAREDQLKSAYLVFSANFHGKKLEPYLRGMWNYTEQEVRRIWGCCVGFASVTDAETFVRYVRRCQVETTFYFNGSTDESLAEQLKGLYLKQQLSAFVFEHQGKPPAEVQAAFRAFLERVRPSDLNGPTWRAGASSLQAALVGEMHQLSGETMKRREPSSITDDGKRSGVGT